MLKCFNLQTFKLFNLLRTYAVERFFRQFSPQPSKFGHKCVTSTSNETTKVNFATNLLKLMVGASLLSGGSRFTSVEELTLRFACGWC